VNAPIARLFVVVIVLFAVLIGFTSRWTLFEADALNANAKNQRPTLTQQRIRRGAIQARDGTLLARSTRRGDKTYTRAYPRGPLFAHAVGYSFTRFGRSGLEQARNDDLTGTGNELGSLFDRLSGAEPEGDDVRTTLDPGAQRIALEALGDHKGAVVALDPRTGAVRVMASAPSYDPNSIGRPRTLTRLNRDEGRSPLLNRTTQAGYPPGSTMKVVTAIAAIDSGEYEPDSRVDGANAKPISGVPLNNFGGAAFGDITLTEALTKSVNTVWAEVGEKLGAGTMGDYMRKLGFGEQAAVDLPSDERRASGRFPDGRLAPVDTDSTDIGRLAIGQEKLAVTPLQMAMVASAVANGGRLMRPHISDRVIDRDGRTVTRVEPDELAQVMSADSAAKVGAMMSKVVQEGSGTAAALTGIDVAGKTGTAEVDRRCGPNQVWFIAFAPAADPRVAVAVTLECSQGTGGVVAAPIAKQVMQELLK